MLPFHATAKMEFGATIEAYVRDRLTAAGYPARLISRWGDAFDLVIDGDTPLMVEVKAARRRMRKVKPGQYAPEWRWHVANVDRNVDHLLALVAEDDRGERYLFLVPSWLAAFKQGLSITSHPTRYAGRLACYLEAWPVIAEVAAQRRKHSNSIQLSFAGD
jgi:hypothetical protein